MKILVTGADGFIGKNLCVRLEENNFELIKIDRDSSKHD
ncbi:NAD(P)-dependent oxidoreductase, partial [Proteus mirabilis]